MSHVIRGVEGGLINHDSLRIFGLYSLALFACCRRCADLDIILLHVKQLHMNQILYIKLTASVLYLSGYQSNSFEARKLKLCMKV